MRHLVQTLAELPGGGRTWRLTPTFRCRFLNNAARPPAERGAVEWGIEKINAPAVWALGYTGQGITVAGADTGYEWDHPAIKPHYRGYEQPWRHRRPQLQLARCHPRNQSAQRRQHPRPGQQPLRT
jgi:hypothetical protein